MSMNEKSIVEEALLQIKAVENAISENAKGILASTMKEEISELVRESLGGSKRNKLREQEEDPNEVGVEDEDEVDVEEPVMDVEDEDEIEGEEPEFEMPSDDLEMGDNQTDELPALDMTQSPIGDVMKVFKLMGDEDGIIVKKDDKGIHLSDPSNDVEYLIQMGDETENPQGMMENQYIDALRNGGLMGETFDEEQPVFELEFDDSEDSNVDDTNLYDGDCPNNSPPPPWNFPASLTVSGLTQVKPPSNLGWSVYAAPFNPN